MTNKLLMVEWLDSAQPVSSWHFLESPPELEVIECASVGWLIGESKDTIMLAPNIGDLCSGGSQQGSGFIRIPVSCITRKVELHESD